MSEKNNQTRLRFFRGKFIASITKPENIKEIFASGDRDALAVFAPVSMDEATAFNLFPEIATSREAILRSTRSSISIDRLTGIVRGNIEGDTNVKIGKTIEYANNNGTYIAPDPESPIEFSVFKSQSLSIVQSQDFARFAVEVALDGSIIGLEASLFNLLNTPDGTYTYTDGGENIAKTFEVSVQNVNGTNVYFIDGVEKPSLDLVRGGVYTFDQSAASNANHPLRFRVGGNPSDPFTDGVSWEGIPGQVGAKTVFTVPINAPSTLQYYCTNHPAAMGNTIAITTEPSGLEFTFEIGTTVHPMGNSRSITNITIVNAGTGYLSDEKITWRMPSGEYIVKETLTEGTWTIPSEELEEDYYYTFSFTQGNGGGGDLGDPVDGGDLGDPVDGGGDLGDPVDGRGDPVVVGPGDGLVPWNPEDMAGPIIFQDSATYQAITIRKGNRFEIVPRNQRFNLAAADTYISNEVPQMLFTADPDKSAMTEEGMKFQIDGSREVAGGEEGVIAVQYEKSATASLSAGMLNPDIRFSASSVGNIRPADLSLERLSENLVVYLTKEIVLSETIDQSALEPAPIG